MRFKTGDLVEVRSREEILATLDDHACLDELPFMPEMLRYCGKTFRVASSAHKTCDTISQTGGRRMQRAVHLEGLRCDGSAHGNCEAGCLLFWKHAWLKKPGEAAATANSSHSDETLAASTRRDGSDADPIYACQATRLLAATEPLPSWDLRQFVADLRSGNATASDVLGVLAFAVFNKVVSWGVGYRALVGAYDRLQRMRRRPVHYPSTAGTIPAGTATPIETLDLKPGETVRVKSHENVLSTLDTRGKNRGMSFDAEMVPYCGKTFRVLRRVTRIIDESTGRMLEMKTPCVVLDGVVCRSRYSAGRMLCPRAIYSYWRESWLERTGDSSVDSTRG